uniref:discoidin domain-containing protein n=1 Tax=Collinsella intestinalis TaxID=147207 RepID=UPI00402878F2
SKWSDPIESTSLEDPWRNAPKPVETSWEGGYYGGFKESLALDHSLDDSHFHSDANAIGKAMVLNYGQAMMLDKFEYYPRNDAANGTVTKMRIETSLDGNHWSKPVELDWNKDNKVKTYEFPTGAAAQYVRLTPLASVGNFFSARELAVYKKDGTKMWEVGSNKQDPSVSENDFTNMKNYLGVENRAPHATTFNSQIAGHYADLNNNGVYDVYDYSFTMAKLDDGTKKGGKVSGSVEVVADKEHVAPGDVVTVSVMTRNARNANALGAVVNFMSDEFELQDSTIAGAPCVAGMENLSVAMTNFADGKQSVNVAFANRGDKALFNGSETVATFKLKAKKEADVKLPYISMLVGPKLDVVELATDENGNLPEQPGGTRVELTQDDFNIKITNKGLPKDEDGTNVTKMIQGGSYGPLFDGVEYHDGNEGKGTFELKWEGKDDIVSIEDMNISFELKEPRALADVQLVNRMNQAGEVGGNGFLSKVAAVMTFEDGSTQKFEGGEFDKKQGIYTFAPSKENAAKKVVKVDIKPLETPDVHMLTISEINFNYVEGAEKPEKPQVDK